MWLTADDADQDISRSEFSLTSSQRIIRALFVPSYQTAPTDLHHERSFTDLQMYTK